MSKAHANEAVEEFRDFTSEERALARAYLQARRAAIARAPASQGTTICISHSSAEACALRQGLLADSGSAPSMVVTYTRDDKDPERWVASQEQTYYQAPPEPDGIVDAPKPE